MPDLDDLDSTKICEKCKSVMKLHSKHARLQWFEYVCPICDESVYNNYFPTNEMIIEEESEDLFYYINKHQSECDKNLYKEILINLVEKLNKKISLL